MHTCGLHTTAMHSLCVKHIIFRCAFKFGYDSVKLRGNKTRKHVIPGHVTLLHLKLYMHITVLLFTQVQPALESAAAPQISSICLCCHRLCLYSICFKCLFASLKCQAQRAAVCWIVAIKTESTYVHTHTTL